MSDESEDAAFGAAGYDTGWEEARMGDIGENYDPPIPRLRSTRRLLRPTSSGLTPREEALRRAIARDQAELAKLETERERMAERFGTEPPRGTVITFPHRYPSSHKTYTFAALRGTSYWYLTGRETKEYSWSELCAFIGDAPFRTIPPAAGKAAWMMDPTGIAARRVLVLEDEATKLLRSATEPKSATERALERLQRFSATIVASDGRWIVIDDQIYGGGGIVETDPETGLPNDAVAVFSADHKGEKRARQSARDRNRAYREQVRRLEVEPPVWSRVSSVDDHRKWARRQEDGWVRYSGTAIMAVRLSWDSVKLQLGEMRPGTGRSSELINESTD